MRIRSNIGKRGPFRHGDHVTYYEVLDEVPRVVEGSDPKKVVYIQLLKLEDAEGDGRPTQEIRLGYCTQDDRCSDGWRWADHPLIISQDDFADLITEAIGKGLVPKPGTEQSRARLVRK